MLTVSHYCHILLQLNHHIPRTGSAAVPIVSPMSSLPPELLLCILENVYHTPKGKPNYKLLKACARVCRLWSGPAQSLLFRSVTKRGHHNIHAFHAALLSSAARGKALGNCVRTLDITISSFSRTSGNSHNSSLTVAKLLQVCPHVHDLSLVFYGVDLEEESLEMLRVAGQELKTLSLVDYGSQRPILYQLLSIWPNIQSLKIGSTMSTSLPWGNDASSPPQSNADNAREVAQRNGAKICLHDLVLSFLLPPAVLAWLLASSTDSLRTIELRESPGLMEKRILTDILVPHAPRLRSLRLWFYNDDSAALLRICTSLEELVLYGLELPPRCPLVPNLPPTIKHLTFRVGGYNYRITTLQPIIDAVDALPNLKVLTCNRNMRRQQYDNFAILEGKCRMKGVVVVLSDGPTENWVGVMFYNNHCFRSS